MLTPGELERYDRQIKIMGIGEEGQEKLKQAKVIIAGGGGLGSASSLYLAAAGVGTIRIVDNDRVELSNLNRQVLHWDDDIGRRKVASAAEKLKKLNLPADQIEHFYSPPTEPVLDKKGREIICQTCQGSGYVGRTGVFEVMKIDENIRAMIADNASLKLIKQQSRKARMYYLMEEGLLKVIDGTTSMDEVLRGLRDDNSK